jgi:hypothetical protein
VQVQFGAGKAQMHVSGLATLDYPNLPISVSSQWQTSFVPATISFDVVWNGPVTRRVNVRDGTNGNQFAGEFMENEATVTWSASNTTGFSFQSNPGNFSTSVRAFAELGHERNGIFFQSDSSIRQRANPPSSPLLNTGLATLFPSQGSSAITVVAVPAGKTLALEEYFQREATSKSDARGGSASELITTTATSRSPPIQQLFSGFRLVRFAVASQQFVLLDADQAASLVE